MRPAHRVWYIADGTTDGTMLVRHCNCLTTACTWQGNTLYESMRDFVEDLDDRELANLGMTDYARLLKEEDSDN